MPKEDCKDEWLMRWCSDCFFSVSAGWSALHFTFNRFFSACLLANQCSASPSFITRRQGNPWTERYRVPPRSCWSHQCSPDTMSVITSSTNTHTAGVFFSSHLGDLVQLGSNLSWGKAEREERHREQQWIEKERRKALGNWPELSGINTKWVCSIVLPHKTPSDTLG